MAKKMNARVYFLVMQNGEPIASYDTSLTSHKKITLSSHKSSQLYIPLYPFSRKINICEIRQKKIYIDVDHGWSGFVSSQGEPININKRNSSATLVLGDYASLSYNDLSILIKIQKPPVLKKQKIKSRNPNPAGLFSHMFDSGLEAKAFIAAAFVSAIIWSSSYFGISALPDKRPRAFEDLSSSYVLPFIYSKHLENSPEALQNLIHRTNYEKSVMHFTNALASMLFNWQTPDAHYMFKPSYDYYTNLHNQRKITLEEYADDQRRTEAAALSKPRTAMFTIPTVSGESIQGMCYRVFDKIDLLHESLELTINNRKQITKFFPEDSDALYDFSDYSGKTKAQREAEAKLAQISPFHMMSNEEVMYQRAGVLAAKASELRRRIKAQKVGSEPIVPENTQPLSLAAGVSFASFLSSASLLADDAKIASIEASIFGTPVQSLEKIQEPLIGEIDPNLIKKTIAQRRYELQLCYELALRRDNNVKGEMEWSWRIDSRGRSSEVSLLSSSIKDNSMKQCIKQKIARWTFPRPRRGSVEVRYPFEFTKSKG